MTSIQPSSMSGGLVDAFLDALSAERGLSQASRAAYASDLAAYLRHLSARERTALTARTADVEAMIAVEAREGRAPSSRARRLSAIRGFHRFLVEDGLRADDPAAQCLGPKLTRSPPAPPRLEHIRALSDAAAAEPGRRGLRLVCCVELLYGSGLRVSELTSLPADALAPGREMLRIRGKGGRERIAPISARAAKAIAAWRIARDAHPIDAASRWAFPSHGATGRMTRESVYRALKKLARKAGAPEALVSPHALRHAFATDLLSGGADLRVIQTLLGHADIGTTQIYTYVSRDALAETVETLHPLARRSAGDPTA